MPVPAALKPFAANAASFLVAAGYQPDQLRHRYIYTARSPSGFLEHHEADLVAFSNLPHSMRTACIAILDLPPGRQIREDLAQLRYLGVPILIAGTSDSVELWSIRKDVPQQPFEVLPKEDWTARLRTRVQSLAPESVAAAKRGVIQLDFIDSGLAPWAEEVTEHALITLLEKLVLDARESLAESYRGRRAAESAIIRVIFHLFAARALEDKGVIETQTDPYALLTAASDRFPENVDPDILDSPYVPQHVVSMIYKALRDRFAFASLNTDMLGHAYENAMVTPELRHDLGIYYTPRRLTQYILGAMPIESIPAEFRYVCDPCCGSGSFLMASFDRLSDLLPKSFTAAQRHQYLRARLIGFDIDEFAREIASLSLVLTDLHNRNGWKIREHDVLTLSAADIGRRPNVLVTNPPFREFKTGSRREASTEILERLIQLAPPNGLIGIVLPLSALESKAATSARAKALESCDILEIATFPGGMFYSQTESTVWILRKRGADSRASRMATVRELKSGDMPRFDQFGAFTRTYPAETSAWQADANHCFAFSPFPELWRRLREETGRLGDVAVVRHGLQLHKDDVTTASDVERPGDKPFVDRLNVLRPFIYLPSYGLYPHRWMKYNKASLRRHGSLPVFQSDKVLINSNRNPASAWRLVAAIAHGELYFSDNFHGIMPHTASTSLEQLAAVLNSPVANAWFDAHSRKRKIVIATLLTLPYPRFDQHAADQISVAVHRLEASIAATWKRREEGMFYDGPFDTADAASLLAEVDDLVYRAYGLTSDERKQIEKLMAVDKRPS